MNINKAYYIPKRKIVNGIELPSFMDHEEPKYMFLTTLFCVPTIIPKQMNTLKVWHTILRYIGTLTRTMAFLRALSKLPIRHEIVMVRRVCSIRRR